MIFVDTGAWVATVASKDSNHTAAVRWVEQNRLPLVTTDYVIDETLTLLKARDRADKALELGTDFFGGELTKIHLVEESEILAAWQIYRTFTDKDWSFTDCTSKVVMDNLGVLQAFSFDHHFRQFGSVQVVP